MGGTYVVMGYITLSVSDVSLSGVEGYPKHGKHDSKSGWVAGLAGVRGGHSDGEKLNSGALEEIGQSPSSATRPDSKNNNLPGQMTPATPRTPREDPWDAFLEED